MKRIAWSLLACAVLVPVAAGCLEQTALLVEFTSPLSVPDEVDQLELHVEGLSSGQLLERRLDLDSSFPHSFLLRPGDDPDEDVSLTVTARRRSHPKDELGTFVLRRVVMASFRTGMLSVVSVELSKACIGVKCPGGVDCVAGLCVRPWQHDLSCEGNGDCDDGDPCNGEERCEDDLCTSAPKPDCSDGVACTEDSCQQGECIHTPLDELCSEGSYCDPETGCSGGTCSSDTECDDGLICTGVESCQDGECHPGTPFVCEDDLVCTVDRCDETEGGCTYVPDHTVCDDGIFCNGAETCGEEQGCLPGVAPDCDDNDPCTDDTCVEDDGGSCQHTTRDKDGDGHGDQTCEKTGDVLADDCDDEDARISPDAPETCNGVDDDCDGDVDEGCSAACSESCEDAERVPNPNRRLQHALNSNEHVGSCGGEGAEAVFSFSLETVSDVFVTTHGSELDTVLYVRACSCDGPEVGCNDDADGMTTSALQLTALTPGTYTLFADTKDDTNGVIQLDLYVSAAARPGYGCGQPVPLPASGVVAANTCGATSSGELRCGADGALDADSEATPTEPDEGSQAVPTDPDGGGEEAPTDAEVEPGAEPGAAEPVATPDASSSAAQGGDDTEAPDHVYYMVVTGETRPVVIDTCTGCTAFDSMLELRRVCMAETPSDLVACDDNACASSCSTDAEAVQSRISEELEPGIYYIIVDGRSGACGDYELKVSGL